MHPTRLVKTRAPAALLRCKDHIAGRTRAPTPREDQIHSVQRARSHSHICRDRSGSTRLPNRPGNCSRDAGSPGRRKVHTCPAAPGPPRPRLALTWPVMPVMSATFLGLPISPSPEPRVLGQRAGACAISPRGARHRQGGATASAAEAAVPGDVGVYRRASCLAWLQGRAHRAASSHNLTGSSEAGGKGRGGPSGPATQRCGCSRAGVASSRRPATLRRRQRQAPPPVNGLAGGAGRRGAGRGGGACRWALQPQERGSEAGPAPG